MTSRALPPQFARLVQQKIDTLPEGIRPIVQQHFYDLLIRIASDGDQPTSTGDKS